jgi:hypothetical protein
LPSFCTSSLTSLLCHTFGDRSHSSLVCSTSLVSQSTAFCVTQLCLAFLQGFLCKEADHMQPASLCLLRAVTALCCTCGHRSHSYLVCPTPPGTQSTAFGVTQFVFALLWDFWRQGLIICSQLLCAYQRCFQSQRMARSASTAWDRFASACTGKYSTMGQETSTAANHHCCTPLGSQASLSTPAGPCTGAPGPNAWHSVPLQPGKCHAASWRAHVIWLCQPSVDSGVLIT